MEIVLLNVHFNDRRLSVRAIDITFRAQEWLKVL